MSEEHTYSDDEIPAKLSALGLDEWHLDGDVISRTYTTDGWPTTLMAVNAVGFVCEAANHHADLAVSWGELGVTLSDHSAGGISDKDFAVARRIEDTVLWRPQSGGPLDGPSGKWVSSG
jgi:4a-hydroxytetrahydrobiopterin dehydratase